VTPIERTLAEQWPDGTFAGPRPRQPSWTPEQQAQHRADLANALDDWAWDEETRRLARYRAA